MVLICRICIRNISPDKEPVEPLSRYNAFGWNLITGQILACFPDLDLRIAIRNSLVVCADCANTTRAYCTLRMRVQETEKLVQKYAELQRQCRDLGEQSKFARARGVDLAAVAAMFESAMNAEPIPIKRDRFVQSTETGKVSISNDSFGGESVLSTNENICNVALAGKISCADPPENPPNALAQIATTDNFSNNDSTNSEIPCFTDNTQSSTKLATAESAKNYASKSAVAVLIKPNPLGSVRDVKSNEEFKLDSTVPKSITKRRSQITKDTSQSHQVGNVSILSNIDVNEYNSFVPIEMSAKSGPNQKTLEDPSPSSCIILDEPTQAKVTSTISRRRDKPGPKFTKQKISEPLVESQEDINNHQDTCTLIDSTEKPIEFSSEANEASENNKECFDSALPTDCDTDINYQQTYNNDSVDTDSSPELLEIYKEIPYTIPRIRQSSKKVRRNRLFFKYPKRKKAKTAPLKRKMPLITSVVSLAPIQNMRDAETELKTSDFQSDSMLSGKETAIIECLEAEESTSLAADTPAKFPYEDLAFRRKSLRSKRNPTIPETQVNQDSNVQDLNQAIVDTAAISLEQSADNNATEDAFPVDLTIPKDFVTSIASGCSISDQDSDRSLEHQSFLASSTYFDSPDNLTTRYGRRIKTTEPFSSFTKNRRFRNRPKKTVNHTLSPDGVSLPVRIKFEGQMAFLEGLKLKLVSPRKVPTVASLNIEQLFTKDTAETSCITTKTDRSLDTSICLPSEIDVGIPVITKDVKTKQSTSKVEEGSIKQTRNSAIKQAAISAKSIATKGRRKSEVDIKNDAPLIEANALDPQLSEIKQACTSSRIGRPKSAMAYLCDIPIDDVVNEADIKIRRGRSKSVVRQYTNKHKLLSDESTTLGNVPTSTIDSIVNKRDFNTRRGRSKSVARVAIEKNSSVGDITSASLIEKSLEDNIDARRGRSKSVAPQDINKDTLRRGKSTTNLTDMLTQTIVEILNESDSITRKDRSKSVVPQDIKMAMPQIGESTTPSCEIPSPTPVNESITKPKRGRPKSVTPEHTNQYKLRTEVDPCFSNISTSNRDDKVIEDSTKTRKGRSKSVAPIENMTDILQSEKSTLSDHLINEADDKIRRGRSKSVGRRINKDVVSNKDASVKLQDVKKGTFISENNTSNVIPIEILPEDITISRRGRSKSVIRTITTITTPSSEVSQLNVVQKPNEDISKTKEDSLTGDLTHDGNKEVPLTAVIASTTKVPTIGQVVTENIECERTKSEEYPDVSSEITKVSVPLLEAAVTEDNINVGEDDAKNKMPAKLKTAVNLDIKDLPLNPKGASINVIPSSTIGQVVSQNISKTKRGKAILMKSTTVHKEANLTPDGTSNVVLPQKELVNETISSLPDKVSSKVESCSSKTVVSQNIIKGLPIFAERISSCEDSSDIVKESSISLSGTPKSVESVIVNIEATLPSKNNAIVEMSDLFLEETRDEGTAKTNSEDNTKRRRRSKSVFSSDINDEIPLSIRAMQAEVPASTSKEIKEVVTYKSKRRRLKSESSGNNNKLDASPISIVPARSLEIASKEDNTKVASNQTAKTEIKSTIETVPSTEENSSITKVLVPMTEQAVITTKDKDDSQYRKLSAKSGKPQCDNKNEASEKKSSSIAVTPGLMVEQMPGNTKRRKVSAKLKTVEDIDGTISTTVKAVPARPLTEPTFITRRVKVKSESPRNIKTDVAATSSVLEMPALMPEQVLDTDYSKTASESNTKGKKVSAKLKTVKDGHGTISATVKAIPVRPLTEPTFITRRVRAKSESPRDIKNDISATSPVLEMPTLMAEQAFNTDTSKTANEGITKRRKASAKLKAVEDGDGTISATVKAGAAPTLTEAASTTRRARAKSESPRDIKNDIPAISSVLEMPSLMAEQAISIGTSKTANEGITKRRMVSANLKAVEDGDGTISVTVKASTAPTLTEATSITRRAGAKSESPRDIKNDVSATSSVLEMPSLMAEQAINIGTSKTANESITKRRTVSAKLRAVEDGDGTISATVKAGAAPTLTETASTTRRARTKSESPRDIKNDIPATSSVLEMPSLMAEQAINIDTSKTANEGITKRRKVSAKLKAVEDGDGTISATVKASTAQILAEAASTTRRARAKSESPRDIKNDIAATSSVLEMPSLLAEQVFNTDTSKTANEGIIKTRKASAKLKAVEDGDGTISVTVKTSTAPTLTEATSITRRAGAKSESPRDIKNDVSATSSVLEMPSLLAEQVFNTDTSKTANESITKRRTVSAKLKAVEDGDGTISATVKAGAAPTLTETASTTRRARGKSESPRDIKNDIPATSSVLEMPSLMAEQAINIGTSKTANEGITKRRKVSAKLKAVEDGDGTISATVKAGAAPTLTEAASTTRRARAKSESPRDIKNDISATSSVLEMPSLLAEQVFNTDTSKTANESITKRRTVSAKLKAVEDGDGTISATVKANTAQILIEAASTTRRARAKSESPRDIKNDISATSSVLEMPSLMAEQAFNTDTSKPANEGITKRRKVSAKLKAVQDGNRNMSPALKTTAQSVKEDISATRRVRAKSESPRDIKNDISASSSVIAADVASRLGAFVDVGKSMSASIATAPAQSDKEDSSIIRRVRAKSEAPLGVKYDTSSSESSSSVAKAAGSILEQELNADSSKSKSEGNIKRRKVAAKLKAFQDGDKIMSAIAKDLFVTTVPSQSDGDVTLTRRVRAKSEAPLGVKYDTSSTESSSSVAKAAGSILEQELNADSSKIKSEGNIKRRKVATKLKAFQDGDNIMSAIAKDLFVTTAPSQSDGDVASLTRRVRAKSEAPLGVKYDTSSTESSSSVAKAAGSILEQELNADSSKIKSEGNIKRRKVAAKLKAFRVGDKIMSAIAKDLFVTTVPSQSDGDVTLTRRVRAKSEAPLGVKYDTSSTESSSSVAKAAGSILEQELNADSSKIKSEGNIKRRKVATKSKAFQDGDNIMSAIAKDLFVTTAPSQSDGDVASFTRRVRAKSEAPLGVKYDTSSTESSSSVAEAAGSIVEQKLYADSSKIKSEGNIKRRKVVAKLKAFQGGDKSISSTAKGSSIATTPAQPDKEGNSISRRVRAKSEAPRGVNKDVTLRADSFFLSPKLSVPNLELIPYEGDSKVTHAVKPNSIKDGSKVERNREDYVQVESSSIVEVQSLAPNQAVQANTFKTKTKKAKLVQPRASSLEQPSKEVNSINESDKHKTERGIRTIVDTASVQTSAVKEYKSKRVRTKSEANQNVRSLLRSSSMVDIPSEAVERELKQDALNNRRMRAKSAAPPDVKKDELPTTEITKLSVNAFYQAVLKSKSKSKRVLAKLETKQDDKKITSPLTKSPSTLQGVLPTLKQTAKKDILKTTVAQPNSEVFRDVNTDETSTSAMPFIVETSILKRALTVEAPAKSLSVYEDFNAPKDVMQSVLPIAESSPMTEVQAITQPDEENSLQIRSPDPKLKVYRNTKRKLSLSTDSSSLMIEQRTNETRSQMEIEQIKSDESRDSNLTQITIAAKDPTSMLEEIVDHDTNTATSIIELPGVTTDSSPKSECASTVVQSASSSITNVLASEKDRIAKFTVAKLISPVFPQEGVLNPDVPSSPNLKQAVANLPSQVLIVISSADQSLARTKLISETSEHDTSKELSKLEKDINDRIKADNNEAKEFDKSKEDVNENLISKGEECITRVTDPSIDDVKSLHQGIDGITQLPPPTIDNETIPLICNSTFLEDISSDEDGLLELKQDYAEPNKIPSPMIASISELVQNELNTELNLVDVLSKHITDTDIDLINSCQKDGIPNICALESTVNISETNEKSPDKSSHKIHAKHSQDISNMESSSPCLVPKMTDDAFIINEIGSPKNNESVDEGTDDMHLKPCEKQEFFNDVKGPSCSSDNCTKSGHRYDHINCTIDGKPIEWTEDDLVSVISSLVMQTQSNTSAQENQLSDDITLSPEAPSLEPKKTSVTSEVPREKMVVPKQDVTNYMISLIQESPVLKVDNIADNNYPLLDNVEIVEAEEKSPLIFEDPVMSTAYAKTTAPKCSTKRKRKDIDASPVIETSSPIFDLPKVKVRKVGRRSKDPKLARSPTTPKQTKKQTKLSPYASNLNVVSQASSSTPAGFNSVDCFLESVGKSPLEDALARPPHLLSAAEAAASGINQTLKEFWAEFNTSMESPGKSQDQFIDSMCLPEVFAEVTLPYLDTDEDLCADGSNLEDITPTLITEPKVISDLGCISSTAEAYLGVQENVNQQVMINVPTQLDNVNSVSFQQMNVLSIENMIRSKMACPAIIATSESNTHIEYTANKLPCDNNTYSNNVYPQETDQNESADAKALPKPIPVLLSISGKSGCQSIKIMKVSNAIENTNLQEYCLESCNAIPQPTTPIKVSSLDSSSVETPKEVADLNSSIFQLQQTSFSPNNSLMMLVNPGDVLESPRNIPMGQQVAATYDDNSKTLFATNASKLIISPEYKHSNVNTPMIVVTLPNTSTQISNQSTKIVKPKVVPPPLNVTQLSQTKGTMKQTGRKPKITATKSQIVAAILNKTVQEVPKQKEIPKSAQAVVRKKTPKFSIQPPSTSCKIPATVTAKEEPVKDFLTEFSKYISKDLYTPKSIVIPSQVTKKPSKKSKPLASFTSVIVPPSLTEPTLNLPKKYTCGSCRFDFTLESSLLKHQEWHRKWGGFYQCMDCVARFDSLTLLRSHIVIHAQLQSPNCKRRRRERDSQCKPIESERCIPPTNVENEVLCPDCGQLIIASVLPFHLDWHDPQAPVQCTICTAQLLRMDRHMHLTEHHYNNKEFVCAICAESYSTKQTLCWHLERHSTKCRLCGLELNGVDSAEHTCPKGRRRHSYMRRKQQKMMTTCRNRMVYRCKSCSLGFYSRDHLRIHSYRMHKECDQCGEVCFSEIILQAHKIRVHGIDINAQFALCTRSYKSNSEILEEAEREMRRGLMSTKTPTVITATTVAAAATTTTITKRSKKITCDICGSVCQTYASLSAHRRYHRKQLQLRPAGSSGGMQLTEQRRSGKIAAVDGTAKRSSPTSATRCPPSGISSSVNESTPERAPVAQGCLVPLLQKILQDKLSTSPLTSSEASSDDSVDASNLIGDGNTAIQKPIVAAVVHACKICDMNFESLKQLNAHISTHTCVKNFKCNHCEKQFFSVDSLKEHVVECHVPRSPPPLVAINSRAPIVNPAPPSGDDGQSASPSCRALRRTHACHCGEQFLSLATLRKHKVLKHPKTTSPTPMPPTAQAAVEAVRETSVLGLQHKLQSADDEG